MEGTKKQIQIHSPMLALRETGKGKASFSPNDGLSSKFDHFEPVMGRSPEISHPTKMFISMPRAKVQSGSPRSVSNQLTNPSIVTTGGFFMICLKILWSKSLIMKC